MGGPVKGLTERPRHSLHPAAGGDWRDSNPTGSVGESGRRAAETLASVGVDGESATASGEKRRNGVGELATQRPPLGVGGPFLHSKVSRGPFWPGP